MIVWPHRKEAFGLRTEGACSPSLRCGTPPRLGSLPDTQMRKRFAIAVISIPRAASCFYKKPIRSEVWTHKEAPSLNPAHNVGLKDFIDLHAEPYILVLCVCVLALSRRG